VSQKDGMFSRLKKAVFGDEKKPENKPITFEELGKAGAAVISKQELEQLEKKSRERENSIWAIFG